MAGEHGAAGRVRSFAAVVAATLAVGLGISIVVYTDGIAYLTDAPEACARCHVMQPQYAAWQQGSHAGVAVCNDCHTPASPVARLATKARSGLAHAFAYTTGRYPDTIRIAPRSVAIAQQSCRHCHAEIAESIDHGDATREERECLFCHVGVGHDEWANGIP